jgi:hypothetical protein
LVHTNMDYYSVIKIDEQSIYERMWRKCKCVFLSERSQSKNLYAVIFQLYDILEKAKVWQQEKDQ